VSRHRTAESIASLADGAFGRLDHSGAARERANAVSAWRHVAGAEVYAHARGFALRDTELVIFVDSSIWANELTVLAEHYREAVNQWIGKEAVGSIRFCVSKRVEEETRLDQEDEEAEAGRRRERVETVALTDTEREQLRQMAAAVKTEELRETVIAAAIAHLEWLKGTEAQNESEKASQRATEGSKQSRP
jgi:hypothetical protein